MGLGEVLVNPVARLGGTLVAETDIPAGTLRTPVFVPKVSTAPELGLLVDRQFIRRAPEIVCYEILSVQRLTEKRSRQAAQRTISGASADPAFDEFRRSTFSMTDPMTEYFSYKRAYSTRDDKTTYIRDKIAALDGFPTEIQRIVLQREAPWGEPFWDRIVDEEFHLALIDWYSRQQRAANPSILVPPVNLVEGNSSLDLALALNDATAESFPPGEDRLVPAFYLILHPKIFKSPEFMDRLFRVVSERAGRNRIVAFKPLFLGQVLESPILRPEFARFLSNLEELKSQMGDGILNFALDVGEPGLALIGNGFDAYAEPLSGFIWFPQARGKTKEQEIEEAVDLDMGPKQGYWLHPDLRIEKPMSILEIARQCDCSVHGVIPPKVARDAELSNRSVPLRRSHHYNVRTRELELLVESVGNGDLSFMSRVLQAGSNQNLLKLLPTGRN